MPFTLEVTDVDLSGPTFADVAVGDPFLIGDCAYVKVNTTQAIELGVGPIVAVNVRIAVRKVHHLQIAADAKQ